MLAVTQCAAASEALAILPPGAGLTNTLSVFSTALKCWPFYDTISGMQKVWSVMAVKALTSCVVADASILQMLPAKIALPLASSRVKPWQRLRNRQRQPRSIWGKQQRLLRQRLRPEGSSKLMLLPCPFLRPRARQCRNLIFIQHRLLEGNLW